MVSFPSPNMNCNKVHQPHGENLANSESDALPPYQLVQSAAVQAARGCPRLHPDGLRRHHQERLRRRGLHVTQHSARWKQKSKHEFKISKKNHKERKCCCRRCGARFLVGGKLPRVETSSPAAYVPEEERWVSVSLTVWLHLKVDWATRLGPTSSWK